MQNIAANDWFFQELCKKDHEMFLKEKSGRCSCGGRLDTAHFKRKPRGLGEKEETRYSLCCCVEGCRKRLTPRSLRFFGRKIYVAWVVILAIDFFKELGLSTQMSRQTIARWKNLWRDQLSEQNSFMRRARSLLPPGFPESKSPGALLPIFKFPEKSSWIPILKFFIP